MADSSPSPLLRAGRDVPGIPGAFERLIADLIDGQTHYRVELARARTPKDEARLMHRLNDLAALRNSVERGWLQSFSLDELEQHKNDLIAQGRVDRQGKVNRNIELILERLKRANPTQSWQPTH